jgi:DNA-binding NtrC family response regulator
MQAKLLRVLQEREIVRVGTARSIPVDVRVIAATHRDLEAMVRQGLFREDLFYRLRTVAVTVPPLRQRRGDIALLAQHFVGAFNERFGFRKRLAPEALAVLQAKDWPGNVRELLHVVEAAMVVCEGEEIGPAHLRAAVPDRPPAHETGNAAVAPTPADASLPTLEEMERAHIQAALRRTAGHRGQAARLLGISERSLYRKLNEYGLAAAG